MYPFPVYITDRRNSIFDVSTMAPSVMDGTTTIECRFSNPLSSPNSTRQCQLCYSILVKTQTPSQCITQSTTNDDGRLVTFRIQLSSSSGGEYGPFFYTLTAIEDNVTLAVAQGQQYTGKLIIICNCLTEREVLSHSDCHDVVDVNE